MAAGFLGTSTRTRTWSDLHPWYPFLLIILAGMLIFPDLGKESLRDWDEAIYAQISREIVQSGDWITLHHGYEPFFEKPPLLMWITAIFFDTFGVNEFWSRAVSAVAGVLLVWITYLVARAIFDNRTGLLAGLILLASHGFVFEARNGETDMLLSLAVFTGLFAYLRLRNGNPIWWYLVFASCALAFMVKFWAGLVLPAVLVVMLIIESNVLDALHSRHFWGGLLLAALLVIPWHLLVYLKNGMAFIDVYIARDLLERTLTSMEGHSGSPLFYLDALRHSFSPWFFLFPFALALGFTKIMGRRKSEIIIAIEIILIFGLYTFVVDTKNPSYIFPIYPALAILTAHVIALACSTPRSMAFTWILTAALLATTITQDKLLILCFLTVIGLVILFKWDFLPQRNMNPVFTTFVFVAFFLSSLTTHMLGNHRLSLRPIYGRGFSSVAQIATLAGSKSRSITEPLIGFAMEEDWDTNFAVEGPTAKFYSNRPMDIVFTWEQLDELMEGQYPREMIIAEKYLDHLAQNYDVSVIERVDPLVYVELKR